MGETGILEIQTAFHLSANILGCQAPPLEIKSLENPCPDSQQKGQTLLISQSPFLLGNQSWYTFQQIAWMGNMFMKIHSWQYNSLNAGEHTIYVANLDWSAST